MAYLYSLGPVLICGAVAVLLPWSCGTGGANGGGGGLKSGGGGSRTKGMGNADVELSATTLTIHGTIYPLRNLSSVVPAVDRVVNNQMRRLGIFAIVVAGFLVFAGAVVIANATAEMTNWESNTKGRLYLEAKGQRTWGVVLILLGVGAGITAPWLMRRPVTTSSTSRLIVTTNAGERQTLIFSSEAELSAFYDRISRALNAAKG